MVAFVSLIVFWILMIIDAAKREFPNPNDRVMWILIVVLTSWIGSIIYYFAVKRPADQAIHRPAATAARTQQQDNPSESINRGEPV